jgi:ribosomal protein S18 acetylase RimI-like enzyme
MAEPASIRRATPADAAAIGALTRAAYARWVPLIGREPLPMTADHERAVRQHRIDLLCAGAGLLGLIETIERGDHLLIENLAGAPASQGQGPGRRLLGHAEGRAAARRLPEIRLYTNRLFAANLEFYRRRGYGIDREEPFRGGTVVHMSKRVALA